MEMRLLQSMWEMKRAISDRNGEELSDRWNDALRLKELVSERWALVSAEYIPKEG